MPAPYASPMDVLLILLTALLAWGMSASLRRLWGGVESLAHVLMIVFLVLPVMCFFAYVCISVGYKSVTGVPLADAPYVKNMLVGGVLGVAMFFLTTRSEPSR